jgi:hypothetical protein
MPLRSQVITGVWMKKFGVSMRGHIGLDHSLGRSRDASQTTRPQTCERMNYAIAGVTSIRFFS